MGTEAAKTAKAKKVRVSPSAETNRRVLKECAKTTVDLRKVMETFNCSRTDAIVLAAAAENGLLPSNAK